MMTDIHELKILPKYYKDVAKGIKTFELRRYDRDYKRGDILELNEWNGTRYTGRSITAMISYMMTSKEFAGITDGYAILGIIRIKN